MCWRGGRAGSGGLVRTVIVRSEGTSDVRAEDEASWAGLFRQLALEAEVIPGSEERDGEVSKVFIEELGEYV